VRLTASDNDNVIMEDLNFTSKDYILCIVLKIKF
jgi:hypothetical protein